MFDRSEPFNDLPPLPPAAEVETPAVLKKAITASRALAELKGLAERMPNQAMLVTISECLGAPARSTQLDRTKKLRAAPVSTRNLVCRTRNPGSK